MVFNRHDQFIGKALKVYGEYSEGEYDVFSQVVKPGDTVIEAGANLGAHTLGLAQLAGPNGRVYAFEPQRLMFQTLLGNVALNSLTNIYGFQKALSNAPGKLLVPIPATFLNGHFLHIGSADIYEGFLPRPVVRAVPCLLRLL